MKYEDIRVDERYRIEYIDPNYPCECRCHDGELRHTHACCHDGSYRGLATCVSKNNETKLIDFLIDKKIDGGWHICTFAEDVLDKLQI